MLAADGTSDVGVALAVVHALAVLSSFQAYDQT
jgi:hypothetical protein